MRSGTSAAVFVGPAGRLRDLGPCVGDGGEEGVAVSVGDVGDTAMSADTRKERDERDPAGGRQDVAAALFP